MITPHTVAAIMEINITINCVCGVAWLYFMVFHSRKEEGGDELHSFDNNSPERRVSVLTVRAFHFMIKLFVWKVLKVNLIGHF